MAKVINNVNAQDTHVLVGGDFLSLAKSNGKYVFVMVADLDGSLGLVRVNGGKVLDVEFNYDLTVKDAAPIIAEETGMTVYNLIPGKGIVVNLQAGASA